MARLKFQQQRSSQAYALPAWLRVSVILALSALAEHVSYLNLLPIYGSLPTDAYHDWIIGIACLSVGSLAFVGRLPSKQVLCLATPMHACAVPSILHYVLAPLSSTLGPRWGPLITEMATLFPLEVMTFAVSYVILSEEKAERGLTGMLDHVWSATLKLWGYIFSRAVLIGTILPWFVTSQWYSRWLLELLVCLGYAISFPSKLLLLSLVPTMSFLLQNSPHGHLPGNLRMLKRNLKAEGYSLLARREGHWDYFSVLQNERDQFRVLRSDHSLLGGVWLPNEERAKDGITVMEPVFSVFTMLEAVRLMQPPHASTPEDDSSKKALVIGLGIGTCPGALAAHGINTTTLELHPQVSELATSYFGFALTPNSRVLHGDALHTAADLEARHERFDYIVHDVFTGGAEPLPLFQPAFLQTLTSLLTPEGRIAINYAGDLSSRATLTVLQRITTTFANCRLFRDEPRTSQHAPDVANFVAFCAASPWRFREPVAADFLQSQARHHRLLPVHEVDLGEVIERVGGEGERDGDGGLSAQREGAEAHWWIMRRLIPARVWESW